MVARGRGRASEREAIRELVSRLTNATNRRERSTGGTPEFREADEALLRYRHILLDDELFERFIAADRMAAREAGPVQEGARGRGGAPQRRASQRRRGSSKRD